MSTSSTAPLLVIVIVLLFPGSGYAAAIIPDDKECTMAMPCPPPLKNARSPAGGMNEAAVTVQRARTRALIGGSILVAGAYGYQAWWQDAGDEFNLIDEGGFGENSYAGGVDKLGHFYIGYAGTRLLTRGLEWAGNNHGRALRLSVLTVGGIQLAIEVLDGFDRGSGFSAEDAVANILGAGWGYLLETHPRLDEIFDLRVRYLPSREARRGNVDPFGDYSGQTYLFITKASAFPLLARHKASRYLELALGYGAVGYEPPEPTRRRTFYYGLSINLSQLLDDALFTNKHYPTAQGISHQLFEYLQLPGTVYLSGRHY